MVVQGSVAMTEGLRIGLAPKKAEVVHLTRWSESLGTLPSLVVYEALETELPNSFAALAEPLLLEAPWVCVGSVPVELVGNPVDLHTLARHSSVPEVVRLVKGILFGESSPLSVPPSARSSPSVPLSVLPRRQDHPPSQPSMRSPASLLPQSHPQSSKPPRYRSAPAGNGSAAGRLLEDAKSTGEELSTALLAILASAEERIKQELVAEPSVDARGGDGGLVHLTRELATALRRPIGEYDLADVGLSTSAERSLPERSKTETHTIERATSSEQTETPRSSERRPSRPSIASSGGTRSEATHAGAQTDSGKKPEEAFEPVAHRTAKTRPPRTASVVATQRAASVPKAPAVPREAWSETATGTIIPESERPAPLQDVVGPHTSRSAQPGPSSERSTPTPVAPSPQRRDADRISTIPPSAALGANTNIRSAPATEAINPPPEPPRKDADPTTRPPRKRDTAPPPTQSRPFSERFVAEMSAPETRFDPRPEPPSATTSSQPHEAGVLELRDGDAISALARAIRTRFTGAVAFESDQGIRRVVLRDGDLVTAASGIAAESLVTFLVSTGVLSPVASSQLGHRLASFGRHAGAALIAGGYLPQDQLWPTLRAHAEYIVGQALSQVRGVAAMETTVPERLQAEPSVFGGATGAEVLVEICRRMVGADLAIRRLGGESVRFRHGAQYRLLDECALTDQERSALRSFEDQDLGRALPGAPSEEFACVLYALKELGVLDVIKAQERRGPAPKKAKHDPLDDAAIREAVLARRALIENGDYFAVLGVPRSATGYHIRQAFLDLRRSFEPSVVLRAGTLELKDDVDVIVDVLEEAYQVLKDPLRRERYRRALEATPP